MSRLGRWLWLWGPVALYMIVIFAESSLEAAPLPSGLNDKVAHALGFALLGALLARAMASGFPLPLTVERAGSSMVIGVAYGLTDEIHQRFVPGRSSSMGDLIADAAGVVVAVGLVWACGILWPRATSGDAFAGRE